MGKEGNVALVPATSLRRGMGIVRQVCAAPSRRPCDHMVRKSQFKPDLHSRVEFDPSSCGLQSEAPNNAHDCSQSKTHNDADTDTKKIRIPISNATFSSDKWLDEFDQGPEGGIERNSHDQPVGPEEYHWKR
jgi:hypothetical protein